MANKQYISIIRFFNHCDISTGEEFNVSRAKKQLQAEFGIARGGIVEINGYSYTRHDVFEEIEQPDFLNRLVFHKQIWNSPQILELLENNTADFISIKDEFGSFWSNKEFDEFFSPYFVGPFNYLSRKLLAEARLQEISDLLTYEDFLQPAEREEAFRPLRIFLDENAKLLRNVNSENYKMMRPKISHWIDTNWHLFFNNLPHEFYDIKIDISTRLVNIGVAVQKSHRRDCRLMSEKLIALQDTPESLRNTIVSNHGVYMGSSTRSVSWGNSFWVIWVVFMLFRAVASDGCRESNGRNHYLPSDFKIEPIDSILKKIRDSSLRMNHDTLAK